MTDLAVNRTNLVEESEVNFLSAVVKDSETVAKNVYAGIDLTTNKLENAEDAANICNLGVFTGETQQRENQNVGDGTIQWSVRANIDLANESITGVVSTTEVFSQVFATDNATLQISQPAAGDSVGFLKKYKSDGVGDIHVWSIEGKALLGMMGGQTQVIDLGDVHAAKIEGTSKTTIADYPIENRCSVVAVYANKIFLDSTTSAGARNISLEKVVGGTPSAISTSQVPLAFGDAQGAQKTLAAAIASNTLNRGNSLRLVIDAGGTGWEASKTDIYNVKAVIKNLPGA